MKDSFVKHISEIDFFGMVDRAWASHAVSGVVDAHPLRPLIENVTDWDDREADALLIADHFFDEMRKEYPNAILVCHL